MPDFALMGKVVYNVLSGVSFCPDWVLTNRLFVL
jgi:hypothetical protein